MHVEKWSAQTTHLGPLMICLVTLWQQCVHFGLLRLCCLLAICYHQPHGHIPSFDPSFLLQLGALRYFKHCLNDK